MTAAMLIAKLVRNLKDTHVYVFRSLCDCVCVWVCGCMKLYT